MSRQYYEGLARKLSNQSQPDQLRMAAEMVEQAELPNASVVHKQSMLGLAHALLDRISTDIAGRLAAMGIHSQPKLTLPETETKKQPKREW